MYIILNASHLIPQVTISSFPFPNFSLIKDSLLKYPVLIFYQLSSFRLRAFCINVETESYCAAQTSLELTM